LIPEGIEIRTAFVEDFSEICVKVLGVQCVPCGAVGFLGIERVKETVQVLHV
jgi:hypothetical protein